MKSNYDGPRELDVCISALRDLAAAFFCAAILLLHGLTHASAADIAIRQAWARATPNGAQVAAGYFTIENRADSADKLLSASTPIAARAEIHEMLEQVGVMKMRPMNEGLTIPPNGKLTFAPGGRHLMLVELRSPLAEGEQVPVSLEFEKAGQINISLKVAGIGAKGPQPSATSEGSVRSTASEADPFFTHIHHPRVMANVTVSTGRSGAVEVLVQLEDPQENALVAEGLTVTLTGPDSGSAPISTSAERITSDTWRAQMVFSEAGRWDLALQIAMIAGDKIEIAAPILIE